MSAPCLACQQPIDEDPLECKACKAVYHRSCRLGAGRCLTEGCKRGKALESTQADKNQSALQMNAFPFVFGLFVGLAAGGPIGAVLLGLPPIGVGCVVLVVGVIAGSVAHQLWG